MHEEPANCQTCDERVHNNSDGCCICVHSESSDSGTQERECLYTYIRCECAYGDCGNKATHITPIYAVCDQCFEETGNTYDRIVRQLENIRELLNSQITKIQQLKTEDLIENFEQAQNTIRNFTEDCIWSELQHLKQIAELEDI